MDELILAKSKAGHDKNHIYVVMEKQEDVVYLVNGTTKTCANPKKKKPKKRPKKKNQNSKKKAIHIQSIKHLPQNIIALVKDQEINDTLVGEILDLYNRRNEINV